jgi:hypothetical protein
MKTITHRSPLGETPRDVLAALEPDQLVLARRRPLPRRALKPAEVLTLWLLRLYLVAAIGILIYQVVGGSH